MAKPEAAGRSFDVAMEKSREHRESLSDVNVQLKQLIESLKSNKERIEGRARPAPSGEAAPSADAELRTRLVDIERENRRMLEQFATLEDQSYRLTGLYVALHRLHESTDRLQVMTAIEEVVVNILGSEQLAIFEMEPKATRLVLVHSMGINADRWREVAVGEGTIGKVVSEGRAHVNGPAEEDKSLTACIPLRSGAQVVGALAIFELLSHKPLLGPFDLDLLDALSVHAGSALRLSTLELRSKRG